jgi:hypothetical protein
MRSLLAVLVFPLWVLAAPPTVAEKVVSAPVKELTFLTVKAEAGKKVGTAPTYDAKEIAVVRLWSDDPDVYEYQIYPRKAGRYFLPFWTDGERTATVVEVVAGDGTVQPPPVKPDPVDPPVGGKFYFLIVRADGPVADKKVIESNALPAWEELIKDGHFKTDKTRTEIAGILKQSVEEDAAAYKKRLDSYVGRLVVLRVSLDGKSSSFVGDKPLPADDAAVKGLVK